MNEKKSDAIDAAPEAIPWFGAAKMIGCELAKKGFITFGPDLVSGLIEEDFVKPIRRGQYMVGAWVPRTNQTWDWGTLTVRGPGSWVLSSRDGGLVFASNGRGTVFCLKNGGVH